MKFEDFWYVVALQSQLKTNTVLERTVLGEWLAIFRGDDGKAVALCDRCLHCHSRLSQGKVCKGTLQCPYHGWVYDKKWQIIAIPAEGATFKQHQSPIALSYPTREENGYLYVRLTTNPSEELDPFPMPYYEQPGWETVRVINRFANNVTNCVENFIDIPHTASVHPGVFRTPRGQKLAMTVTRKKGSVLVEYRHETNNLGWFDGFLNPQGKEIRHQDSFHMPNITQVEYDMGENRRFFITSQSVPESNNSTLVYTDVTVNYGIWKQFARLLVRWTAQYIIRQDIAALGIQREVIEKYGTHFSHTPADTIHVFVESIINKIAAGEEPRALFDKSVEVTFWV